MRSVPLTLLALALLAVTGCKKIVHDSSGNKSIDNLVAANGGGPFTANECRNDQGGTGKVANLKSVIEFPGGKFDQDLFETVENILGSLHQNHLDLFFVKHRGNIILNQVSRDEDNECIKTFGEKIHPEMQNEVPAACYRINKKSQGLTASIVISNRIAAKPASMTLEQAVKHSLIRTLTYAITFYTNQQIGAVSAKINPKLAPIIPNVQINMDKMVRAFYQDLKAKKSPAFEALHSAFAADPRFMTNALFAEVVDSHYCSKATRNRFMTQYPCTYAEWKGTSDEKCQ